MHDSSIWDYWSGRYERLWVQKYSLGPTRREIISIMKTIVISSRNLNILDMGCGTGQLLRDMKKEFGDYNMEYTGVDQSSRMIETARQKDGTINYFTESAENFESHKKYDIIACTHSFPYYDDQQEMMNKFYNMLKDGGYLLLAQASQNNFYDKLAMSFVKLTTSSAKYPSVKEVKTMLPEGFTKVETIKIKEIFYMPSIYLYICSKGVRRQ